MCTHTCLHRPKSNYYFRTRILRNLQPSLGKKVGGFDRQEQTMRDIVRITTENREQLVDVTDAVTEVVRRSGIRNGLVSVYAQGATGAVMIQENWDQSVQTDVVDLLRRLIPRGVWLHDAQDGNGDAHLKAGLVGPSETVPLIEGEMGLSRWQNIFFCEFDGPRAERRLICTVIEDR